MLLLLLAKKALGLHKNLVVGMVLAQASDIDEFFQLANQLLKPLVGIDKEPDTAHRPFRQRHTEDPFNIEGASSKRPTYGSSPLGGY
jgi:hypothetical protein